MFDRIRRIYEISGGGPRFHSMEGLRAFAALLVFQVHYFDSFIRDVFGADPNQLRLSQIADPGLLLSRYFFASHYGVDIFFFLSGFLVCRLVSRRDFSVRGFVAHRMLRIYPAALAALLVAAYIRIDIQGAFGFSFVQFVGNILFLNGVPALGVEPYTTVTWSLFYEMLFYLTFPAVLVLRKPGSRLTPIRLILFAGVYLWGVRVVGGMYIRFWMFFGGALMATLTTDQLRALARRLPGWLIVTAFLAATLVFAEFLRYDYFIPPFLVVTFLLVAKVLYGQGWLCRLFSWVPLRYLGNVSYSFYLVHGLAVELVMDRYRDLFAGLNKVPFLLVTFVLCLLLSFVLATVLFVVAERPYFQRKRRIESTARVGDERELRSTCHPI